MDIKKRLTRKPLTTALWAILVAAMTLLLGVGCALLYSSGSLVGILDSYYTSIAVRTDREHWEGEFGKEFEDKTFTQEDAAYFESLDCVEEVYFHTLSAAYCPDFVPAISPGEAYYNCDNSYADVLLIGEVTELSPLQDYGAIYGYEDGHVGIFGVLKIEEIILQNTDYTNRVNGSGDEYLNFSISVPDLQTAEYIQIGNRYVFFGWYDPHVHGKGLDDGVTVTPPHPWIEPFYHCELVGNSLLQANYYNDSEPPVYAQAEVTRIEGTWEEFLADPANAIYTQMMERWDKQQHAQVVLGTDNLDAMYAFTTNAANVVEGRSFTQEEYDSGAKVCILNESMAVKAGIAVGDTITLEQYLCHDDEAQENYNWSVNTDMVDGKLNNPNIGHFNIHTEYAPAEEFTVVGLYRMRNEWDDSSYSISPNTLFIPRAAQIEGAYGGGSREVVVAEWVDAEGFTQTIMDTTVDGTFGIYFSMKLKNGMVEDFEELMEADPRFANQFITVDQGFGSILEMLNGITASSARLTGIVLAGWGLLLALYVLLYQGRQSRNLGIMRSLGAEPREAAQYLWGSGMTVAALGVAIGSAAAGAVMGVVQTKLFDTAFGGGGSQYSIGVLTGDAINVMVADSQLPVWGLLLLALAELAVFALTLWLHARKLSNQPPRKLLAK